MSGYICLGPSLARVVLHLIGKLKSIVDNVTPCGMQVDITTLKNMHQTLMTKYASQQASDIDMVWMNHRQQCRTPTPLSVVNEFYDIMPTWLPIMMNELMQIPLASGCDDPHQSVPYSWQELTYQIQQHCHEISRQVSAQYLSIAKETWPLLDPYGPEALDRTSCSSILLPAALEFINSITFRLLLLLIASNHLNFSRCLDQSRSSSPSNNILQWAAQQEAANISTSPDTTIDSMEAYWNSVQNRVCGSNPIHPRSSPLINDRPTPRQTATNFSYGNNSPVNTIPIDVRHSPVHPRSSPLINDRATPRQPATNFSYGNNSPVNTIPIAEIDRAYRHSPKNVETVETYTVYRSSSPVHRGYSPQYEVGNTPYINNSYVDPYYLTHSPREYHSPIRTMPSPKRSDPPQPPLFSKNVRTKR